MLTFKQFLLEGGNVSIGNQEAQKIDLKKISREKIKNIVINSLREFNDKFNIWSKELFESKEFFSGSAFQLINAKISDDEFVKMKSTVGDIDTMVSKEKEESVKRILDSIHDETFGDLTFIGYKKSAGQFITLWSSKTLDQNIQIDLELTEFSESGFPTKWSKFAHSSSLEDMQSGIKGVFNKKLINAITGKNLKKIPIKTAKGIKNKLSSELAFSVESGLRKKFKTYEYNGNRYFIELETKNSIYYKDFNKIMNMIFDFDENNVFDKTEIEKFKSFIGLTDLINKYLTNNEKQKVFECFCFSLFNENAQKLYKNKINSDKDKNDKLKACEYLIKKLHCNFTKKILDDINNFYKNYK